jgi:hypothetical protein
MKKLRFGTAIGITVLTAVLIGSASSSTYASGRPVVDLRSLTSSGPQRAYLAPGSFAASRGPQDPMSRFDPTIHGSSLENLAYKISFVGGLLLTADRVVRSVDSVMDRTALRTQDGSCLRLNAEPCSRGFLVGFSMSRPLDF